MNVNVLLPGTSRSNRTETDRDSTIVRIAGETIVFGGTNNRRPWPRRYRGGSRGHGAGDREAPSTARERETRAENLRSARVRLGPWRAFYRKNARRLARPLVVIRFFVTRLPNVSGPDDVGPCVCVCTRGEGGGRVDRGPFFERVKKIKL